jgi:hypothetical protein
MALALRMIDRIDRELPPLGSTHNTTRQRSSLGGQPPINRVQQRPHPGTYREA